LQKPERIREELEELLPKSTREKNLSIAVLLPCCNEKEAIALLADIHDARMWAFRHEKATLP